MYSHILIFLMRMRQLCCCRGLADFSAFEKDIQAAGDGGAILDKALQQKLIGILTYKNLIAF